MRQKKVEKRLRGKMQLRMVDEPERDIEHKMNRKWVEKKKTERFCGFKGKAKECPLMGVPPCVFELNLVTIRS